MIGNKPSGKLKVTKKSTQRVKHVPQRTCVGCREVLPKRQMVRIVRTADGVQVDSTGKLTGRGAYMHDKRDCWVRGMRGALAHALKAELTAEDRVRLESFMNTLPTHQHDESETNG
jgi:predicted RNA-binding protein YlxR (DUF448 family)